MDCTNCFYRLHVKHSHYCIIVTLALVSICGGREHSYKTTLKENHYNSNYFKGNKRISDQSNMQIGSILPTNKYGNSTSNRKHSKISTTFSDNNLYNKNTQKELWDNLGSLLINQCKMTSIVLISDHPYFEKTVKKILSISGIPFFHYGEGDFHSVTTDLSHLTQFIRASFVENKHKHFVIISQTPGDVLSRVESVFLKESNAELALLPHDTKWIVALWTDRQWEEVVEQQSKSVLDNVVVIKMRREKTPILKYNIDNMATFVWRANRMREPSKLDPNMFNSKDCVMFPNTKYGMNGRELAVGPKVFYGKDLRRTKSSADGKVVFCGFLMDVLNYTSKYANYTYVLDHSVSNITWLEYAERLNNGSMDIGLSMWTSLSLLSYNVTLSDPVAFDAVIGIYRRPEKGRFEDSWAVVCPFQPIIHKAYLMFMLFTSLLYALIVSHQWKENRSLEIPGETVNQNRPYLTRESESTLAEYGNKTIQKDDMVLATSNKVLHRWVSSLFLFLVLSFRQSYIQSTSQNTSAKILVAVWAFGSVAIGAIFSSSITANMVIPNTNEPLRTIEEFVERKDYKCSMIYNSILYHTAMLAKEGTCLAMMKGKSEFLTLHNGINDPVDDNLGEYLRNLKQKTVFFHQKSAILNWLEDAENPDDYVIMDKDPIFHYSYSIVFGGNSGFQTRISSVIRRLYEAGILSSLKKTYSSFHKARKRKRSPTKDGHQTVFINHLFWTCILCLICLLFSLTVLCVEILQSKWPGIVNVVRKRIPVRLVRFRQNLN